LFDSIGVTMAVPESLGIGERTSQAARRARTTETHLTSLLTLGTLALPTSNYPLDQKVSHAEFNKIGFISTNLRARVEISSPKIPHTAPPLRQGAAHFETWNRKSLKGLTTSRAQQLRLAQRRARN
jgi:hypothetical protein